MGRAVTVLARSRGLRILVAVAASLALLVPAAPARAATFAFSNPQTSAKYNQGVDFSIDLASSEAPSRVELHLMFPGSTGPLVVQLADTPTRGSSTLHYTLDTSGGGHLMPNTPITSSWAAYPQGGGAPVNSSAKTFLYLDDTQNWQTLNDGIVTVHWTHGAQSFGQKAAQVAVKAISTDAQLLGIDENKPVDFFIYADDASFRAALGPGARENVGGTAITSIRTLFAEFTPDILNDPWVGVTITHELTHQVIDDATSNPYRSLPRWLNEGVAVYQSESNTSQYRSLVGGAISSGDLLPLTALGWQFPTDPNKTALAYAEAVSAVDYIARTFGKPALVKLILAYKNGPTDDEALTTAVGQDMATFQNGWYQAIGAKAPSQFGPQPAPSGPLPSGWSATAPTPAPAASGETSSSAPAGASPIATPATSASAAPTPLTPGPDGGNSGSGGDLTLVLGAIVVVAAAVLAGMVLAGRRAASQ